MPDNYTRQMVSRAGARPPDRPHPRVPPDRQVIVVTHNPNIVVHGDAEFVLSLEAGNGQTRIRCDGGLQEQKVRDEICRVMEGGSEAFETRYRRIMPAEVQGS